MAKTLKQKIKKEGFAQQQKRLPRTGGRRRRHNAFANIHYK